jgi:hypothetical protein
MTRKIDIFSEGKVGDYISYYDTHETIFYAGEIIRLDAEYLTILWRYDSAYPNDEDYSQNIDITEYRRNKEWGKVLLISDEKEKLLLKIKYF